MPRELIPLKRENKGDTIINIGKIFRNPDIQNEVVKKLKEFKPKKVEKETN